MKTMKTAEELAFEQDCDHGAAATVDAEWIRNVQRDAWEQGFEDGAAYGQEIATNRERGELLKPVRVPLFPGDRR
jgi:hypothetical protein